MIFDLLSICNDTHNCNGKSVEEYFTGDVDFTWRVSDCEELSGLNFVKDRGAGL